MKHFRTRREVSQDVLCHVDINIKKHNKKSKIEDNTFIAGQLTLRR